MVCLLMTKHIRVLLPSTENGKIISKLGDGGGGFSSIICHCLFSREMNWGVFETDYKKFSFLSITIEY